MPRLTSVLLVVQAVNALLASLLQVVAFGALTGVVGSIGLLVLAAGAWRQWRWAPRAIVVVEVLTLLGTVPRLLQALQVPPDGAWVVGCIALPLGVLMSMRAQSEWQVLPALLLASAVPHLALAGEHGLAFAFDGVLLLGLAVLVARSRRWRTLTGVVLLVNLVGYAVAVGPGREAVDGLGLTTKLVELVALGLLASGWQGMAGLALTGLLVGGIQWASVARDHGLATHAHAEVASAPATHEQRVAAIELAHATRSGIARYADVESAIAAGYQLSGPPLKTMHYMHNAREHDTEVLQPERPEGLVYVNTEDGPLLVGAVFTMPKLGLNGPTPGGPITHWHTHNVCIALPKIALTGLATPLGACPPGSINVTTPEMMHVWTIDVPGGPFADDLDDKFVARLAREGGRSLALAGSE